MKSLELIDFSSHLWDDSVNLLPNPGEAYLSLKKSLRPARALVLLLLSAAPALANTVGRGFSDGLVTFKDKSSGRYGRLNKSGYVAADGTVIAEPIYDKAGPFCEGIGIVYQGKDWYFLNEDGVKVF